MTPLASFDVNAVLEQSQLQVDALQGEALQRMLKLCAKGHPFYQREWAREGIDIESIRSTNDIAALPLTLKSKLMREPEAFRLNVTDLPLEERALAEVIYTTGSTSAPTPIYNTTHDIQGYMFQARRVAAISGLNETDVIANLFPLTAAPMGAFQRSSQNAMAVGASIVATLPGAPFGEFGMQRSLDEAVRLIELHKATIVWGVTSFVRRILLRALKLESDFSHIRMCAVSGEASTTALRQELRQLMQKLGAAGTIVFDRYGSTELGGLAQCREEGDWHNPAPELQFLEIVDPDTGRRLPTGERGALALTHLNRRGTVLVRFVVGDIVSLALGPCPHCGRAGERVVGPVVRSRDLVKIKGMLVNPAVLLDVLDKIDNILEYQVIIQKSESEDEFSMDEMLVRVATNDADQKLIGTQVIGAAAAAIGVRPRVVFVRANEIFDPNKQAKAVRLIDRRLAV